MSTQISPMAGQPAQAAQLVAISVLLDTYYSRRPDPAVPAQRVEVGTSGHRASTTSRSPATPTTIATAL